ncbi:hypothetical protein BGZ61DRAFT_465071 [Ilyonectria robusta]|uniref:uncharacterized protein n=1 Tax=Ilyonectria robusta TaxID=1079257 RepID=UPI001E8CECDE|nr:uncharacterized protein BGZ61DRAFT_465071 [Ilyonectria robusta]KAH8659755.1 hypothetical protein BGZ61DRAFT_465071 [Ilyonectria robusta]
MAQLSSMGTLNILITTVEADCRSQHCSVRSRSASEIGPWIELLEMHFSRRSICQGAISGLILVPKANHVMTLNLCRNSHHVAIRLRDRSRLSEPLRPDIERLPHHSLGRSTASLSDTSLTRYSHRACFFLPSYRPDALPDMRYVMPVSCAQA